LRKVEMFNKHSASFFTTDIFHGHSLKTEKRVVILWWVHWQSIQFTHVIAI